jgi:2,4-diaminopentanoate dehydrogenase
MKKQIPTAAPLRIVQWTTGNVARQTVRAILARDDLELVGAFAHSASKAGRDIADLCNLSTPTGITATRDVAALLALGADCVVYTPLHIDVDEVAAILRAGVNVVTSSEFLTGGTLDTGEVAKLEAAAAAGQATLFGSGMNPGFIDLIAGVAAGASLGVRHVRVTESVDVSLYAADGNMDNLGWGRPHNDPGHAADVERATVVFAEGLAVLARILGLDSYEPRCTVDVALATKNLDLPGRPIATGTVAGLDVRWEALCDGEPVIELHQRWVMGKAIEPPWTVEHGWVVEVDGNPRVRLKVDIWPDTDDFGSLTPSDLHDIGMRITGVPLVNAIPSVCAAAPGIRTYADLPAISTKLCRAKS